MSDSLSEYLSKRQLGQSPEPAPDVIAIGSGPLLFCIQKHNATRLHYDLRLELHGVLKSWALPKGLPFNYGEKRLAVATEDHPLGYATFEGVIPAGHYGAGEMIVWDYGCYTPDEGGVFSYDDRELAQQRIQSELEAGKISFFLKGGKAKGSFALIRMKDGEWLIIKHKDRYADPANDPMLLEHSALSNATIENLGTHTLKPVPLDQLLPHGPAESLPDRLEPMLATPADSPFSHSDWIYEPKLDGYRTIAILSAGKVTLLSRRGLNVTAQYPQIVSQLAWAAAGDMIIDGEIVAFGANGQPSFSAMQRRAQLKEPSQLDAADLETPCVFYVFDLLHHQGVSTRAAPLLERKRWLYHNLLPASRIALVDYIETDGETMFLVSQQTGLEGIIAKRSDSRYDAGKRSKNWLKIKNVQTADFVVGGISAGQGSRGSAFGALLLGYWQDSKLIYAGHVGSGFNDEQLTYFAEKLAALRVPQCPFCELPPLNGKTTWVRPELVLEVKFHEWTPDGNLRAPVFVREREDKDPRTVSVVPLVETGEAVERFIGGFTERDVSEALEQLQSPRSDLTLQVCGETLSLTSLDRVYWPEDGITKRDLLRYLVGIAPWMLRHTVDKPMTLIRFPEGIHGEKFFQKHWDNKLPSFVETIALFSGTKGINHEYVVCNNLPTLLWLAQLGTLEFHVPHLRASRFPDHPKASMNFLDSEENLDSSILNYPDQLTFDIDPYIYSGKEAEGDEPEFNVPAFEKGKEVAFYVKEVLDSLGLKSFIKTSGKTGLHIFAPIIRNLTFDEVRAVCETISRTIFLAHPNDITIEWNTKNRTGKIFMDYNMNIRGKTLNSAFSPRALPGGVVSMPVTWEELPTVHPHDFRMSNAASRMRERGDPWQLILESKTDLGLTL